MIVYHVFIERIVEWILLFYVSIELEVDYVARCKSVDFVTLGCKSLVRFIKGRAELIDKVSLRANLLR